jgi:hypothetical protein
MTATISIIHQWLYSTLLGPGLLFIFVIIFAQTVGFLGRMISPRKAATYTPDNTNTE